MEKRYMLKEVEASSDNGDKIIVERIFEGISNSQVTANDLIWSPLAKIVITDRVIDLDDNQTFIHPRTGKLFRIFV